jgi:hypothetical protein
MKAKIEVKFVTINGVAVNDDLLKKVPQLKSSTDKTVKILCEQINKYFQDNKIKVETKFELT